MPFCSNCGNALKTGAKFCSKCGAQMSLPGMVACPVCHKPVVGDEKFCVHCGTKIARSENGNASVPNQTAPAQPANKPSSPGYTPPTNSGAVKPKKKGGCLWKSLLIFLFLVAAGLTTLYFLGDEPNTPDIGQEKLTNTDISGIVSIDDTITEDDSRETPVATCDPQQAAEAVEDAFSRADTTLLKQMLTPNSQEIYKDAFREIKPYMNEYSKAFINRKLKISTPIYSLYEFTDEAGKKYTAEFALSDDGQWKLVRF